MALVLKVAAAAVAVAAACVLFLASLEPDSFSVQRSATVRAAPERIYPLISDLHRFLFFDVDAMVGRDFESGLANLRLIAERS
jgi:hypothetical protein